MQNIESIPVDMFTRWQVAEMLGVSLATVNLYTTRGKRITNDLYIKLNKTGCRYRKEDLQDFINKISQI